MQFTTDEQLAHTLAFLQEVRDFIASWPPHPMRREMLNKIDAHLADPLRSLVAKAPMVRSGGSYTPAGLPVLSAELVASTLTVRVPPKGKGLGDDELVARLRQGEVLELFPPR